MMRNISQAFFLAGAVFALCGMVWGIQMSATGDHLLSPAHGHLNLIGFVAMSVFGAWYALTPAAARSGLAKAHFALSVVSVVVLVPGIAMAITGRGEALAKGGSVLAVLALAMFAWVVLRYGRDTGRAVAGQPAE